MAIYYPNEPTHRVVESFSTFARVREFDKCSASKRFCWCADNEENSIGEASLPSGCIMFSSSSVSNGKSAARFETRTQGRSSNPDGSRNNHSAGFVQDLRIRDDNMF